MANATARASIQPYLTLFSYLKLRILYPLVAYLPLSLSYAMISLPFRLPFGAKCVSSLLSYNSNSSNIFFF